MQTESFGSHHSYSSHPYEKCVTCQIMHGPGFIGQGLRDSQGRHYIRPSMSSTRHELQEQQEFVNGQKVYDLQHERRFHNGQLTYNNKNEKNAKDLGYQSQPLNSMNADSSAYASGYPSGAYINPHASSTSHSSQSSSLSSSRGIDDAYDQTSSAQTLGRNTHTNNNNFPTDVNFDADLQRLRNEMRSKSQPLYPLPSNYPMYSGGSHRSEFRTHTKYINGKPVFISNHERKYVNGELVHNNTVVKGPQELGTSGIINNYESIPDYRFSQISNADSYSPGSLISNPSFNPPLHFPSSKSFSHHSIPQHDRENGLSSDFSSLYPHTYIRPSNRINNQPYISYAYSNENVPVSSSNRPYVYEQSYNQWKQSQSQTLQPSSQNPNAQQRPTPQQEFPHTSNQFKITESNNREELHKTNQNSYPNQHNHYYSHKHHPVKATDTYNYPYENDRKSYIPYSRRGHSEIATKYSPSGSERIDHVSRSYYPSIYKSTLSAQHESSVSSNNYMNKDNMNNPYYSGTNNRHKDYETESVLQTDNNLEDSVTKDLEENVQTENHQKSNSNTGTKSKNNIGIPGVISGPTSSYNNDNSVRFDQERYDISPLDDEASSVNTNLNLNKNVENFNEKGQSLNNADIKPSQSLKFTGNQPSGIDTNIYSSHSSRNNFISHNVSSANNLTTIHIPSWWIETTTTWNYFNGRLLNEIQLHRFYENGMLVHENTTDRTRNQLIIDGIDVTDLDLTPSELNTYGLSDSDSSSHSQKHEIHQIKRYQNGDQIYELNQERFFVDGEMVNENRSEKDEQDFVKKYKPLPAHSIRNTNFDSRDRISTHPYNLSGIHISQPYYRRHEVKQEQEFVDGQKVYDLHHERKFHNGELVHENRTELGPEQLGTRHIPNHDALQNLIRGHNLDGAAHSALFRQQKFNKILNKDCISCLTNENKQNRQNLSGYQNNYMSTNIHNGNNYRASESSVNSHESGSHHLQESSNHGSAYAGHQSQTSFSSIEDPRTLLSGRHNSLSTTFIGNSNTENVNLNNLEDSLMTGLIPKQNANTNMGGSSYKKEHKIEEHYENGHLIKGEENKKQWKDDKLVNQDSRTYFGESPLDRGISSSSSSVLHGNPCPGPCLNGGHCVSDGRGAICACNFGFKGSQCEIAYCPARFCRYGGQCSIRGGRHMCQCQEGHTGYRCMTRIQKGALGVHQ